MEIRIMQRCIVVPAVLLLLMSVTLCPVLVNSQENMHAQWEEAIQSFETSDSESIPPRGVTVFVGSSSIRMWKTLSNDMSPFSVINRGFGGCHMDDVVFFMDRIVIPYKPNAVFIYAGDNDIAAGKTPARVLNDFTSFVGHLHAALPKTPIFFLAIKPSPRRLEYWPAMKRANVLIERLTLKMPYVTFVDVASPMLDNEGNIRGELFLEDRLHMNTTGYDIWTHVVYPRLETVASAP